MPTVCDSYLAGVSVCVFTAAGQLWVCPHYSAGEHVFSSTGSLVPNRLHNQSDNENELHGTESTAFENQFRLK